MTKAWRRSSYQVIALRIALLLVLAFNCKAESSLIPVINLLLEEQSCQIQAPFARDEFDCDSLALPNSPWSFVNESGVNASIDQGLLQLELTESLLWFQSSQGVFMHRPVSGNFKATTSVKVFRTSDPDQLPNGAVQLAGLMVRDPESDADSATENYLFIVAGFDVNDISVETKTTIDNVSTFEGPSWPGGEAELRICRLGSSFFLYKRLPGDAEWLVADDPTIDPVWPFVRPDLPQTLQVGLNIYTSRVNFDVSAEYEFLEIETVEDLQGCQTD